MTQKIFVDVSSARVQTLLEHTEHKGAKELDLDILYKLVNEQQQKISCNASAEITSSGTKAASDLSSGEVREGAGGPGVKKTKTASDVACTGEVLRTTKADCIGRKMTSEEPDGCDLSSVSTTPSSEVCTSSTEEHDASKPREATTVASDGDDFFCSDRSTLCTAASSTAPLNSTSSTAATEADVGHTSSIAAVDQPRKIQRNAGDEGMMQKTDQFATPAASLAEIIAQDCQIIRRETVPDHRELSEIEVLRLKQEERAYQKSVANVTAHGRHTARKEIKAATEGMALAGHFVLSFVGAFLCGFYVCEIFVVDEMAIKALVGGMCSFATLLLEAALFLIREHKEEKKRGKLEKQATFHYSHTLRGGTGTRNRIVPTETSDEQEQGLTKTPARAPAAREDSVSRGSSRAKGGRDETTGDDRDSREDVRDNEQAEVATASANSSKQGEMGENWVGEVDELDTPKNFTIRQRRS